MTGAVHAGVVLLVLLSALTLAMPAADADDPARDAYVIADTAALLRLLDFARPELAPVKAALDRGDIAAAGKAYIAHFRRRPIRSPLLTDWRTQRRDPAHDVSRADAFLAGHLHDGYSAYEVPETGLDWRESPLSCCTRFPLIPPVRSAYHHTRDPKYARWCVDHMLSFIRAWPMSEYVGHNSREGWTSHTVVAKPWYWCMMPERMHELAETVTLLRDCPEVTDDELLVLLRRMLEEARYCHQEIALWVVELRHNGGCSMIESQAMLCAVLEDFLPTRACMAHDAEMALSYLTEAFYPDGMCIEMTTAYSLECAGITQRFCHALRDQPAIAAHRDRVARLVECMAGLSEPGGLMPSFGDLYASSLGHAVYGPALDWLEMPWARTLTSGRDGPLPPFLNWPPPDEEQWCGYYAMRSDWGKLARYLCIDCGPWGTTHIHGDRLSLVLDAYGQRFIIDPSSTRYASNEPGAFISVQRGSFLHNVVTVDGVDAFIEGSGIPLRATEPLHNTWEQGETYTLFAGSYSFQPVRPVRWERRVLFVGGQYWLLQDVLTGQQARAAVERNFQFEADTAIEFDGDRTIATAPNGARLVLLPLEDGATPKLTIGDRTPGTTYFPDGKPKTVQAVEDGVEHMHGRGWTGRSSDRLMPAPAVTYVGQIPLPAMLTIALVPLAPGQARDSLPEVTGQTQGESTLWTLPLARGNLRWETNLKASQVLR
jgi:Heparinase II/III-like protein/Heparinase II/III N-terminus